MSTPIPTPGATQPVNQVEALSFALEQRTAQLFACESALETVRSQRLALEEDLARALKLGALGALLGEVIHKLTNPLGVVLGHARGLQRTVENPGVAIEAIGRQAQRAAELV